jgi:MrcB-like, N-terminal domain/AAA domain (dynein-related subfamily)
MCGASRCVEAVERGRFRVFHARGACTLAGAMTTPKDDKSENPIRESIRGVLQGYADARSGSVGGTPRAVVALKQVAELLQPAGAAVPRHAIRVKTSGSGDQLAEVPWVALFDEKETISKKRGVFARLLFRADTKGVYLTLAHGLVDPGEGPTDAHKARKERADVVRSYAKGLEEAGFDLESKIDLATKTRKSASEYVSSTLAHKRYPADQLPPDADLLRDVDALLAAYVRYLDRSAAPPIAASHAAALAQLQRAVAGRGFVFEPWQIAAYVTALRTKPFVILAGVSGTGKSRLPALVAELTGGVARLFPVKPDWTDSSDLLGYVDLQNRFRPGALLQFAREAEQRPDVYHVAILDELNLARVEQYFAEVLSRIEDRHEAPGGGFETSPLLSTTLEGEDAAWKTQRLPPNLGIVGTVNMDETTHGFSRKVLDRAFTLELSDIDLSAWKTAAGAAKDVAPWPLHRFQPRALRLGGLVLDRKQETDVENVIKALTEINVILARAQLQVGYRVRDEIALFVLHARELEGGFDATNPIDLALQMKILPRIVGGSATMRAVLVDLLGWAMDAKKARPEEKKKSFREDDAGRVVEAWKAAGRRSAIEGASYPHMAARLALMWDRLLAEGYTSFWL